MRRMKERVKKHVIAPRLVLSIPSLVPSRVLIAVYTMRRRAPESSSAASTEKEREQNPYSQEEGAMEVDQDAHMHHHPYLILSLVHSLVYFTPRVLRTPLVTGATILNYSIRALM